jgi:hypothetical protein
MVVGPTQQMHIGALPNTFLNNNRFPDPSWSCYKVNMVLQILFLRLGAVPNMPFISYLHENMLNMYNSM